MDRLRIYALLLAGSTVLFAAQCAHAKHIAVVADQSLYESIAAIHALEQTALCGQPSCASSLRVEAVAGWTLAKSVTFNQTLLPAAEGGRQFNRVLKAMKPGDPLPAQVPAVIDALTDALAAVTLDFPNGTTKDDLLSQITAAHDLALRIVADALTVLGAVKQEDGAVVYGPYEIEDPAFTAHASYHVRLFVRPRARATW